MSPMPIAVWVRVPAITAQQVAGGTRQEDLLPSLAWSRLGRGRLCRQALPELPQCAGCHLIRHSQCLGYRGEVRSGYTRRSQLHDMMGMEVAADFRLGRYGRGTDGPGVLTVKAFLSNLFGTISPVPRGIHGRVQEPMTLGRHPGPPCPAERRQRLYPVWPGGPPTRMRISNSRHSVQAQAAAAVQLWRLMLACEGHPICPESFWSRSEPQSQGPLLYVH